MRQVIRRVAAAFAVFPVFLVSICVAGVLFGAIGTGIDQILQHYDGLGGRSVRGLLAAGLAIVAMVGLLQILKTALRAWSLLSRTARVRQALEDSVLIVAFLGVFAGLGLLVLLIVKGGILRSVPAVGVVVFLVAASMSLILPRARRHRNLGPPDPKYPGALGKEIPRAPRSTEARAERAAGGSGAA